ncbi:MAG: WG repeat-containing protein [Bdellovibrionales bacterium]|nr:WG repeat-containing protein [Bdellovibrionales bacterium]
MSDRNELKLTKTATEKIKYNSDELAELVVPGHGCYWVHRLGPIRKTHCYDNGADYFKEGLARYLGSRGKYGYMNKQFSVVVRAEYDFAFPFGGGVARVCDGCKKSKASGEHGVIVGGKWSLIDQNGVQLKSCPLAREYWGCKPD